MRLPAWLQKDYSNARPETRRSVKYYISRFRATPPWADQKKINALYRNVKRLRRLGRNIVLDHIVPLHSPRVCGLHCEANLRIVNEIENISKSNHCWPDMWFEQQPLPIEFPKEVQLELPLPLQP